jgi:hypothetical protein
VKGLGLTLAGIWAAVGIAGSSLVWAEAPAQPTVTNPATAVTGPSNPPAQASAGPVAGYLLVPFFPFPVPVQAPPNLMVSPNSPGARPLSPSFPYLIFVPYPPGRGAMPPALPAGSAPATETPPEAKPAPPAPPSPAPMSEGASQPAGATPQGLETRKPVKVEPTTVTTESAVGQAAAETMRPTHPARPGAKAKAPRATKPKAKPRKLCWKNGRLDVCR